MPPRYPAALTRGARIAVTAPSSGVPPPLHARLDIVLAHLRRQGFEVEEGRCLRDEVRGASAPAAERAAELMQLLLRDDVAAIVPPWGGELAIELLDRLDWNALQGARPKWLLGFSDTSTLLLALTLRLGWATAHGACLMDLAPGQHDALTAATLSVLATPTGGRVTQRQSERWQREWTDFARVPDTTFQLTEPTVWRCINRDGDLEVRGRLIGGCIDTLMHTAGTAYGDVRAFIAGHRAEGCLLYLENAGQSPTALVQALHRLRWSGWLDGLNGVLIGRSAAPEPDPADATALRYQEALFSCLAALDFPVLIDLDIGHCPPQFTLVNGALAELRWNALSGGELRQVFA
jgi:muramoyltetrapeptide carboxypeptidase LdcA involved in peptidoglycan recycling